MITCMKSRPFIVACLLLTLTSLFWSGNFVFARAMHAALPPMALSFGRWLIAFVLLAPFALPRAWRDRRLLWEQRGRLLLLAALGVAGFNSLVYTGVQFTTATNAVLLNSFIPILTVAFGALFFRQGLHGRQVAGLMLSFAGVLLIISRGEWARLAGLDLNRGDLIVFVAMVFWAVYTLAIKEVDSRIDRLGLLGVLVGLGVLIIAPLYAWEHAGGQTFELNAATLATFAYVGTLPSVAAYFFFNLGVGAIGPARAAMFIHLMPAFGALLSVAFLGEAFYLYHALGIAGILAGVGLSTRGR